MPNIAIIWDLENVTPPASNSLFIDSLWDYAEGLGRVVAAKAYADWSMPHFTKLAWQLKKYHFYLVHVPSERKKKNSVDIQLVSDTLEQLRLYEHIDTMVLVTGDSDFRPLLLTLRRAGKITHVVCDIKTASQDLLAIADSFKDYRDILPNEETEEEESAQKNLSPEYWFSALAETVNILFKENKPTTLGAVKIKMKMLNPNFDEQDLGYKRWSDFISAAVKQKVIQIVENERNQVLLLPDDTQGTKDKNVLQKALKSLVDTLSEMDQGKERQFHEYSQVSSRLRELKIDLKSLGFNQFKKFIQAADVRGLVETRCEGVNNYVRLMTDS